MGKRMICLFLAAVFVVTILCGTGAVAEGMEPTIFVRTSGRRGSHRPNALATAMVLVLAGVSVSMLFDKRK